MISLPSLLGDSSDDRSRCDCEATFDGDRLRVDASACAGGGRLERRPECRETVVGRLAERDADLVLTHAAGVERVYEAGAAALLVAAGRFVETIREHDGRLAARAARDPVGAAREAVGRADAAADVAAQTGLAELALPVEGYEHALAPLVGLALSDWRVDTRPPPDGVLADTRDLDTGGNARIYDTARDDRRGRYLLVPRELTLEPAETATLAAAHERLAAGSIGGDERAAIRALAAVADGPPVAPLPDILRKHTRGHGLFEDLFTDPGVSDVFVTAPAQSTPLHVRVEDRTLPTNVRLTRRGLDGLASRYRRESGRGFSRADPTLDAATTVAGRPVRVAAVTEPASDGMSFALRAHDRDAWRLRELVANGTLTPAAAGLLSVAVERGSALVLAGARGAGKTTLLGALLPELPAAVRTVVVEDTPELPVDALRDAGRDVQRLRASAADAELSRAGAVRTALRLGDGALVVGEVRGEEAHALYEAMRVGANSEAVLGTVHGDGADAVYERVVSDLGVPASSFGATDAVVTLERSADGTRRVRAIEEVLGDQSFAALYDRSPGSLSSTGRIDRGNSRLVASLCRADESYAGVRARIAERVSEFDTAERTGSFEGGER
jgi:flagellar protein FlaI